jgi:hypothetical protein
MDRKRRFFLWLGAILPLASSLNAKEPIPWHKEFEQLQPLIEAVQQHLFPSNGTLPSAKEMKSGAFLFDTMAHSSFDRDIRAFVLEGAKEFETQTKGSFIAMSHDAKEEALRAYEKRRDGKAWISRLMIITIEGLLGDPIYGSNIDQKGWKALGVTPNLPQPKERYLGV